MLRLFFACPGALGALLITAVTFTSAPLPAHAQACAEGRVSSAETAGRCCWPGQVWSDASRSCEGTPSCPSPWVAHGDGCAPPMVAPSPTSPAPASPAPASPPPTVVPSEAPPPRTAQPVYIASPEAVASLALLPPGNDDERRPRFIAYGTTGILTSWTVSATIAPLLAIFGLGENVGFYMLQLVPVAGPLLAPFASRSGTSSLWWIYGALGSSLQITAWIILIAGLVNRAADRPRELTVQLHGNGVGIAF